MQPRLRVITNMPVTTAIDDFPGLMREWAEWVQNLAAAGFSDSTTIWRAQFGYGGGEFKSTPPQGLKLLETHGPLRRLVAAMDWLSDDEETRPYVSYVQAVQIYGLDRTTELFTCSRAKVYQMTKAGEAMIRREMKRR